MCEQINLGAKIKFSISHAATTRSMRANNPSHGTTSICWLGYADDLAIVCTSADDLKTALDILHKLLQDFGLVMSLMKTETMIMNFRGGDESYPKSFIEIAGKNL